MSQPPGLSKLENIVNQNNITNSPNDQGEEHATPPQVDDHRNESSQQIRQAMVSRQEIDVPVAVHHQHPHDCSREEGPQPLDKRRKFFLFLLVAGEDCKRQPTGNEVGNGRNGNRHHLFQ